MSPRWFLAATLVALPAAADRMAPDAEAMRIMFPHMADMFALRCSREAPMPAKLAVHLKGDAKASIAVTTKATGAFARCFLQLANQTKSVGPFDRPPEPFDLDLDLTLTPPQRQLESSVKTFIAIGCQPRPGAIPRRATYDVTSNKRGLTVSVTTSPDNAEVTACLDEKLRDWVKEFGPAAWDLKAHSEVALAEPLSSDWLQRNVRDKAPPIVAGCGGGKVELHVFARAEDPELSVDVDHGDAAFRTCIATRLVRTLHDVLAVPRKLPNGKVEPYFRIVSDVDTTVSLRP